MINILLIFNKAILQSTILYFQFQTTTSYITIVETSSEFPAVTICNINPIDFTGQDTTGKLVFEILSANNLTSRINATIENGFDLVNELSSIIKANIIANKSIPSIENVGFTMQSMLISCYFNDEKCNHSDFAFFHTFEYGNCYTFNSKKIPKTTTKYGPTSGLSLELFLGSESIKYFLLIL